ncbi:MAG TPA: serine/threonine-protein kinase [Pirellulales bacterium]|jgi:serine/threonine-protein kinase|nr:serine/threonine-protein kinase [Pirellulales bacterium]
MTQTTESLKLLRAAAVRSWVPHPAAELRASSAEPIPTEAGSWRLEGVLGEGTLARVFAAQPVGSTAGRPAPYALKMLRPRWHDRPEAIALMRREALVGRSVANPHLVAILVAHVQESPYFVVMPRLAGETLAAVLARDGTLDVLRALWIARQTAEALDALHRQGFLHGDVKPSNIQLAPTGHATLLDLSFVRPMSDSGPALDTPLMGTPSYLAPEQISSTLRNDQRSDIYSLGAVLYEMLAGEPPFAARELAELLELHRQNRPRQLRSVRPDVPSPLAKLIGEMIAKEPLRRPQTMGEVIRSLVRLEIDEGASAAMPLDFAI